MPRSRALARSDENRTGVGNVSIANAVSSAALQTVFNAAASDTLTPYTLHPTPDTRHPTPYTLHLTPYTLNPAPYT
jgi:hypothetical protein